MKLKEVKEDFEKLEKLSLANENEIIRLKERLKNLKWIISSIAFFVTVLINWLIYYLRNKGGS